MSSSPGQVHVAGADKASGEVVLEHIHHFFLYAIREAAARAEVGHLQLGQFIAAGVGAQPVELAVELLAGLLQHDFAVAIAIAYLADQRQQRHFEQDHMQPGAAQANDQLAVFDTGVEVAQVEAKQAEKAQEIRLQEADAFQKAQLIGAQAQFGQALDLETDLRQVRAQILAVTATKLPFDFDVGVVVQHRLHHRQFVEVGVEQVLHDAIGKHTLAHNGNLQRCSGIDQWR
ncbi:UNVERIFIED_ORG: hypothetical protein OKW16_004919 [Pseudomonas reinekei]|nr:hypothetical protein [Pseudomonas reinekei]